MASQRRNIGKLAVKKIKGYNKIMNYLLEYLKDGAKFEALQEDKGSLERYTGSVLSFDKNLKVTKLKSDNKEYKLNVGSDVELMVYTPKGVYSVKCSVLNALDNGWELSYPKTVKLSHQREYQRIDFKTEINVIFTSDDEEIEIQGMTKDICAGGVAFDSSRLIPEGEDIELEFELEEKNILANGKVAYSIPIGNGMNRTGVIMTSLDDDDALYIADFCSEYADFV